MTEGCCGRGGTNHTRAWRMRTQKRPQRTGGLRATWTADLTCWAAASGERRAAAAAAAASREETADSIDHAYVLYNRHAPTVAPRRPPSEVMVASLRLACAGSPQPAARTHAMHLATLLPSACGQQKLRAAAQSLASWLPGSPAGRALLAQGPATNRHPPPRPGSLTGGWPLCFQPPPAA